MRAILLLLMIINFMSFHYKLLLQLTRMQLIFIYHSIFHSKHVTKGRSIWQTSSEDFRETKIIKNNTYKFCFKSIKTSIYNLELPDKERMLDVSLRCLQYTCCLRRFVSNKEHEKDPSFIKGMKQPVMKWFSKFSVRG